MICVLKWEKLRKSGQGGGGGTWISKHLNISVIGMPDDGHQLNNLYFLFLDPVDIYTEKKAMP